MDRYSNLYFSKYSHSVHKDDEVAYYHSLRMRPVFVGKKMYSEIQKINGNSNVHDIAKSLGNNDLKTQFYKVVDALVENKILSSDKDVDEKAINVFGRWRIIPPICCTCFVSKPSRMSLSASMLQQSGHI